MAFGIFGAVWAFSFGILFVLAFVFWLLMLIDCATKPKKKIDKYGGKFVWILIIALLGLIGAAVYYFVVKRKTD